MAFIFDRNPFTDHDIIGTRASDTIYGNGNATRIDGGSGHDIIDAGTARGEDELFVFGGAGNDFIIVGGNTEANGGSGRNTINLHLGDDGRNVHHPLVIEYNGTPGGYLGAVDAYFHADVNGAHGTDQFLF